MEEKKYYIGNWLAVLGFMYLTFITWLYALFVKDAFYMLAYIALFITCGIIVSPPLIKIDDKVKVAVIATVGVVVFGAILLFAPVSLGTMIGQFLALLYAAFIILRALFFIVVFLNVCLIIVLGWLFVPCCCFFHW